MSPPKEPLRVLRCLTAAASGFLFAFCVVAALMTLLGLLLTTSTKGLVSKMPVYKERLTELAERGLSLVDRLGLDLGQDSVVAALKELPLMEVVGGAAGTALDLVSNLFLVLIFVIYLIIGRAPGEQRTGLYGEVDAKVRRYIATKVSTSAATGVLVGVILWLFGLELAMVFGVLAFLLNFIPSVGSIIATLLPLPIALIQFESGFMVAACVALPGLAQISIGNVLEPKLMGEGLDLHPLTVLIALIFWGLVWGVPGMLLATPITAVLRIVLDRIEINPALSEDEFTFSPPAGVDIDRVERISY